MDALWTFAALVLVSVVSAVVGPLVMLRATGAQKDRDRAEEKADRELVRLQVVEAATKSELVRLQVIEAAKLLREQDVKGEAVRVQVAEAARLLKEQDRKIEISTKATTDKLDVIHTLVDGAMTQALQDQLDMANVNLVLLRAESVRDPENAEAAEAAKTMEAKVERLTAALNDRKRQVALVEEQIRQQGEG